MIARDNVSSSAGASGVAASVGVAIGQSLAVVDSTQTVTAAIGPGVDIDVAGDVNLLALYNADESGKPLGHILMATSTGSAGTLLAGILAGAEAAVDSKVYANAILGDGATIDGTNPGNKPSVTIASYAHNLVDASAVGNAKGLFASGGSSGTKVEVRVDTTADTLIGNEAKIGSSEAAGASIHDLSIHSEANSIVSASTTGASGNSLTDALKSLFNNIASFFSGNGFGEFEVPAILGTGGTLTLVKVENAANTTIGAGALLAVTKTLEITANAAVTVDADSSMRGASTFIADATSVNDVFVDSDAIVNILDSTADNPTRILGTVVTIAVDNAIGVNSLAKAEVTADIVKGTVTSISRVQVGSDSDPSEARVYVGANTDVMAVETLAFRALNHQESADIVSRAEAKAFGGLASKANALAEGTVVVRSTIESGVGAKMTGGSIQYEAESDYLLRREPQGAADTVVSTVVEVAREVVRKVTKWLPWPFNKIVRWISSIVIDFVEIFDFGETNLNASGRGVQADDLINLEGDIFINQGTGGRAVNIVGDGAGGIETIGNIEADLRGNEIFVDDVVKSRGTSLSFLVPDGSTKGGAIVHLDTAISEVVIVNGTDFDLVIQGVEMVESVTGADYVPAVEYETSSDHEFAFSDEIETGLLHVDNNGNGDVIFSKAISNVTAVYLIENSGGNIISRDPGVTLESGYAQAVEPDLYASVVLSAPLGQIGSSSQRLTVNLIRADRNPDGTISKIPAILKATALGDIYVNVTGMIAIQDPAHPAASEVEWIQLDLESEAGRIDVVAEEGRILGQEETFTSTEEGQVVWTVDEESGFAGPVRFELVEGVETISLLGLWPDEFELGDLLQVSRSGLPSAIYEILAVSDDRHVITVNLAREDLPASEPTDGVMTGNPNLNFADGIGATLGHDGGTLSDASVVGLNDDPLAVSPAQTTFSGATISRDLGDWVGFAAGDTIVVEGSAAGNDGSYTILSLAGTDLTVADTTFTNETGTSGVTVTSRRTVTFENDTITLSRGSWDGFAAGDTITVEGSAAGNDGNYTILSLAGTDLTVADTTFTSETGTSGVTVTSRRTVTFANNTITLSRGNWKNDGFFEGDTIRVEHSVSNDGSFRIDSISADGTLLTVTQPFSAIESNVSNTLVITGAPTITFDERTLERSSGSWTDDGFRQDDFINVRESVTNDGRFKIEAIAADGRTITLTSEASYESGSAIDLDIFVGDSPAISRDTGSWSTDGFVPFQFIEVSGTASNDGVYRIREISLDELKLTLDLSNQAGISSEGPVSGTSVKAYEPNAFVARLDARPVDLGETTTTYGEEPTKATYDVAAAASAGDVRIRVAGDLHAGDISAGGTIDVTLTANNAVLTIEDGAKVRSTGGTHTYTSDEMELLGSIIATGQNVILRNSGAGIQISLGSVGSEADNVLELSDAELDNVTADVLRIGRNDDRASGAILVSDEIDPANTATLHLLTGSDVSSTPSGRLVVDRLTIEAGTGIALSAGAGTAPVSTSTLAASNTLAGNIEIHNDVGGRLTVGTVDGIAGVLNSATSQGGIMITNGGPITVGNDVVNDSVGPLTIEARESPAAPADLLIENGVSVTSLGQLFLVAGDDVFLPLNSSVTAGESITIRGDHGNNDLGVGTTIEIAGAIEAPIVRVTGEADGDLFVIRSTPSYGSMLVEGRGGTDHLVVDQSDETESVQNHGILTAEKITGLSLGAQGLGYEGIEHLEVILGDASTTFDVLSASPVTELLTIGLGAGDDLLNLWGPLPVTHVTAGPGYDVIDVHGDLCGVLHVTGTLAELTVERDICGLLRGRCDRSGDHWGVAHAAGKISVAGPDPMLGTIGTLIIGDDLAGWLEADTIGNLEIGNDLTGFVDVGAIGTLEIGHDLAGWVETGTIGIVEVGNDLTGLVDASTIGTLSIGHDLAGYIVASGAIPKLGVIGGSITPSAVVRAGSLDKLTIGPDGLSVGQNLAGTVTVAGTLGSVRVAGGTPGTIEAGQVGTVAVYGGYGPVVLRIIENGIERRVELAVPSMPFPQPDPGGLALSNGPDYVNVKYFYESESLANPQLTARITNGVGPTFGPYDLSLVTYDHFAKFNLARLDANGVAGIRNVAIEGDLLTQVSSTASSFFGPVNNPAGIRLPEDHLGGVGIRDFAPDHHIQAASIQAIAFGSHTVGTGTALGASANPSDAARLLTAGTRIVPADGTYRVPFSGLPDYRVGLFIATDHKGGEFDDDLIALTVQNITVANADRTANLVTASNAERGAVTALVTAASTFDQKGRLGDSVVTSVALRGDGGSIETRQWISGPITSTGPLGDLLLMSKQSVGDVTAPSIFGSIIAAGTIAGTIQTTGERIDPITGETSMVSADFGRIYLSDQTAALTTTIVVADGISGQLIGRGDLLSRIEIGSGGLTGTIAVQGNLGAVVTMPSGQAVRLGGVGISGSLSGQIVVLGTVLGDVRIDGGLESRESGSPGWNTRQPGGQRWPRLRLLHRVRRQDRGLRPRDEVRPQRQ